MSCNNCDDSPNVYSGICETNSRIIMSIDPSSTNFIGSPSVVVDIATMQESFARVEVNNSHVISLAAIDISYHDFRRIFYPNNTEFSPNLVNIRRYDISNLIANDSQIVIDSSLRKKQFNLFREMLQVYEEYLKVPSNCWSSCSLTNFQNTLSHIMTLFDVGDSCCIKCSLTLDEFFLSIEQQGIQMSNSGTFDADLNNVVPISANIRPVAVITAEFKSNTPEVPNVNVIWPYLVDFTGVSGRYTQLPA